MKGFDIEFELSYTGAAAENHEIDFYDVSRALLGFQRTLALSTHLVLNGQVITQAPSLRGAKIRALPPEEGSWKFTAGIVLAGTAAYNLATAPSNTPLGHLVFSAYDYVISESLGFHVDYDKSLGQLYDEHKDKEIELPEVRQAQLDSVIEKCSTAIIEIHRPIFKTNTADYAQITTIIGGERYSVSSSFSQESYQYLTEEFVEDDLYFLSGFVSSYNSNTYKGRIYIKEEQRPIPFVLNEDVRKVENIPRIIDSLKANALRKYNVEPIEVYFCAQKIKAKTGHLKGYMIVNISARPIIG